MECWAAAALTAAQRPVLHEEEVEIKVLDGVSAVAVVSGNVEQLLPPGILILTNLRLIAVVKRNNSMEGWLLHLKDVLKAEDCSGMFRRSTRVRIALHQPKLPAHKELGLKFNESGKEEFLDFFHRALAKKSWERISVAAAAPEAPPPPPRFSTSHAGVGGIIRKQEQALGNVDALAKSALSDLDALMKSAREVISVVQRYAAYAAAEREDQADMSETTSQIAEANEMENILQSIGMVSPITKHTAGRMYHEQLARQIADVLTQDDRLARLGGLISLPDLYCLFNRARGTALVSPDDLLCAVQRMERLALSMHLRRFPSGVLVLQLDSFSDDRSAERLVEAIKSLPYCDTQGVTAYEAARLLGGGSLVLAKELLGLAEARGLLCRDDGPQGLQFFPNAFLTFSID